MRNYIYGIGLALLLLPVQMVFAQQCIQGDCTNGQGTLIQSNVKYVGQFKNGEFNGIGICYFPDGGRYQGEWLDGKPHGKGTRLLGNGTQLIGTFKEGRYLQTEEGISFTDKGGSDSYEAANGCISGNCYDGLGVFIFANGAIYTGEFRRGEISGQGVCHYPDGSRYEGEWVDALPHGNGKMVQADGKEKTGQWNKGQILEEGTPPSYSQLDAPAIRIGCLSGNCDGGRGLKSYQDGSQYEGEFKNRQPHGEGTFNYPNGDRFVGQFRDGMPNGKGTLYEASGEVQRGHWLDGEFIGHQPRAQKGCIAGNCRNGNGTYIFSDNSKYVGSFHNGMPQGKGTVFYPDGRRYEGEMADGFLNGYGTLFTQNGKQISGYWKDGLYEGEGQVIPQDAPPTVSSAPDLQVWAVIIGVADYNHMPVLRYPDDDAYRMYAFLKSPEGGALDDEHIKILVDEEATLANIKQVTSEVFGKAGSNDLIMLYFSGHGVPGAFLPYDFLGGTRNQLLHEDLMAILRRSRAKHKLCIADACHSGSMLTARGGRPREELNREFYNKLYDTAPSTALIVSSKSDETSVESSGLRQGVFSHFLIRGLKGEADANRDRYVDVTELYQFISYYVREYTGNKQSPLIEGQYDPNMPVSIR